MPPDLTGLVARAKSGERSAFDELVQATYADMYTLAYRLTGNEEDARDVVQDAYLRAYRGIKRFRGDARFTTWMYRITANCASTQLTKRSRTWHEELDDELEIEDRHPDHNPELRAEGTFERDRIVRALQELPPRLRAVVVLRDVYDLPHDAIADELGITEAAAKVRLHRARRRLRERLFPVREDDAESEDDDARAV